MSSWCRDAQIVRPYNRYTSRAPLLFATRLMAPMPHPEEIGQFFGGLLDYPRRNEIILRKFDLLLPKFHFILPKNFFFPPRKFRISHGDIWEIPTWLLVFGSYIALASRTLSAEGAERGD